MSVETCTRALELDSIYNGGVNKGVLGLFLGGTCLGRDTQLALQYFKESLHIAGAMEDYSLLQESLRGIALCYEETLPDSALHY